MITAQQLPSPSAVAERLTGRDYVSYSALRTYASCPLRYYFKYVEGLPETTVAASLAFGSGIHAAAELWFNRQLSGETPPDLDELLTAFWDAWRAKGEEATIVLGKGDDLQSMGELAERVLAVFRESEFAHPPGRILAVEEELRGNLLPDVPDLLARLDLVTATDQELVVTDLKTARSLWSNEHAQDQAEQLLLYGEMVRALVPKKKLRLEFAVLTKSKSPTCERYPIEFDAQQMNRTKQVVWRVWKAIEAEHFYPNPSPLTCPTCPFRRACRSWTG